MKNRRTRTIVITVSAMVLAVVVVVALLVLRSSPSSGADASTTGTPGASTSGTTQVVVTSTTVVAGTEFTAANVELEGVANGTLPPGAYSSLSQVTGRYASSTLQAGTVVVPALTSTTKPVTTPAPATSAGASPSAFPTSSSSSTPPVSTGPLDIAQGDVAIAVPVTPAQDVGGQVSEGDHIDILVNVNDQGTLDWVFQNVTVLRVTTAGGNEVFVLQLPPNQATEMAFIMSFTSPQPPDPVISQIVIVSSQDYGQTALPNAAVSPSSSDQMTLSEWQNLWG